MTPLVPERAVSEFQRERYLEDGYLILSQFVDPERIEEVIGEIYSALEFATGLTRTELHRANSHADRLRQTQAYVKRSLLDELINSENTRSIAAQLIGGEAVRYNPFTAVKGCGGGEFDFHQDNNYTQYRPALGSINIWVALTDMTPENGCLRVQPGSHKNGDLASTGVEYDLHRKLATAPDYYLPLTMKAGDAVAFTRLTVHGSGPNMTNSPRVAYALQYHRDDVEFLDTEDGEWKRLTEFPRFQTPPLDELAGG